jgi:flavin reductase (DIM6/NTAB) family NADH-FMN oxidoreductase RutF
MQFDFASMSPADRYELLLGAIAPRPIALVSTLRLDGALNVAPYSLFNVMGHDPAIVMLSVPAHPDGRLRDTADNILRTREFVVNLVSESLAEAMNDACIDAPAGADERALARLETSASAKVKPPRISASPAAFECRLLTSLSFGPNQAVFVGEIVQAHVADPFVIDARRGVIDTPGLKLIGAMNGANWRARIGDERALPDIPADAEPYDGAPI